MLKKIRRMLGVSWLFTSLSVFAADLLPYSVRTHPYNGWNSSIRGDNRTIGMGGATAGLGDTFLASTENPSGLAMTLDGADLNFAGNNIRDSNLQNYQNPLYLSSFGTAVNSYPWGFSLGFFNSYREGQEYILPSNGGKLTSLETSISEFRLGIARLIDKTNEKLALGLALNFGTATETISADSRQSLALGLVGSGMYQLPNRLLLGLSYQFPMDYPMRTALTGNVDSPSLPGFYQDIHVPGRLVVGLGWIPNRIFRGGVSISLVGQTPNTTLLRDDQTLVGDFYTVQPRFGLTYTFVDFSAVQSKVYVGSYLENSRMQNTGRLHGTIGLEARFWFMTLGYAEDISINYVNNSFGIGVDVVRMMSSLELIPKMWHPPYAGLFPEPFHPSDIGLARPLVGDWVPRGKPMDPIQIGLSIPARIEKKLEELSVKIGALNLRGSKNKKNSKKIKNSKKSHRKLKPKVNKK